MQSAEFLVIKYDALDFLFNRDDFHASTWRKPLENYPGPMVDFGGEAIPDFDLDGHFKKLFPSIDGGAPRLGAICAVASFCGNGAVPASLVDACYFSLAIPASAEIQLIDLDGFRPLPWNVRSPVVARGVMAIRFLASRIQYLLDGPTFILGYISSAAAAAAPGGQP